MRHDLLFPVLLIPSLMLAQPGALDPAFGSGGTVVLQPGIAIDTGVDIAVGPDTTSYVVAQVTYQDTLASVVVHLLQNGQLDTAFGEGGFSYIHGGREFTSRAIGLHPDGSIYVTGDAQIQGEPRRVLLVKILSDGILDPSFGSGGKVVLPLGSGNDLGADLTFDMDGHIIVVGRSQDLNAFDNSFILRFNMDGTLDNTFSGDGKLFLTALPFSDGLSGVTTTADGSVLAAGDVLATDGTHSLLVKVDPAGEWVASFDGGYRVFTISATEDRALSITWDGDHLFVCGQAASDPSNMDGYLARFDADGNIDSTLNGTGVVILDLDEQDVLHDLALQPDGRIVACGSTGTMDTPDSIKILLVRVLPTGELDTDLDYDGIVMTQVGGAGSGANGMALQPDGKILVTGSTGSQDVDPLVARYLGGDCSLDPTIEPSALVLCPGASDTLTTSTTGLYQWFLNGQAIDGATGSSLPVDGDDAGGWFTVQVTDAGCAAISDSVLVDSHVFLLPSIINEGDQPNLIGDNGEQIYCEGDEPLLVLGAPYDTNVQWSLNGEPIPGADNGTYLVTSSGSYTVQGAPSICPEFIQAVGVPIEVDFHPYVEPSIYQTGILLCPQPEGLSAQWYYNGQPVAGLDQCVIPIYGGSYTVFVDYGDSCSVLSPPFFVVGIAEVPMDRFMAYPNPASDEVHVRWEKGDGPLPPWRLLDTAGRTVQSGSGGASPLILDLTGLENGYYRFLVENRQQLPLIVAH